MKKVRAVLYYGKIAVIQLIKYIMGIIPKNKRLILFSAWFGQKYLDSPKYMYEYLLNDENYTVYWYTRNKDIFNELHSKGKPVVYSRSFRGLWLQIRAIMLVSSVQLFDFNNYFLKNCIYFDLGHGFPIKQSGFDQPDATKRYIKFFNFLIKDINYYMDASSIDIMTICKKAWSLDSDHIIFCNKARTDVLFDETLHCGKNEIIKKLVLETGAKKVIVYMPTHRSCGAISLNMSELLDVGYIQKLCLRNNTIFLIKKHFYHRNEIENFNQYSRIFDITKEDVDPQILLYQADILISDYSAAYIDFLLLDRPIVFYAFDLKSFILNERDLYFKFEDNHAGFKPQTKEELNIALENISLTWSDDKHKIGRDELRLRYFDKDIPIGNSRENIKSIMIQLIAGTYKPKWGGN